ncbi:Uncharacterised protein [Streptococcus pneumoniae]|nr:Uncharacterised protein [Streptococcus pneumoniae]
MDKIIWSSVVFILTVILPPSGEYLIALFKILSTTCVILSVSISIQIELMG